MPLYSVTFKDDDNEYWTDLYMADDHDHAREQCINENDGSITIVNNARIPFHMVERAYYLEKARQVERRL